MARALQEVQPNKENHHGGHPSKLSPTNKCAIVQRILTGKASNAVQAIHFINTIIGTPVISQTVRNTLKQASIKAMVKKKKHLFSIYHRKRRLAFALKYQHWTVEAGRGFFGQMRLKSIGLGQMDRSMCGKEGGRD